MALLFGGVVIWFVYNWDQFADLDSFEIPQAEIYLPVAKDGVVYHKPGFSLSYVEKYELPEWVVYTLDVHMMNKSKNERTQDFNPDPAIATGSGHFWDYKKCGYRRGLLVTSSDMSSDIDAMNATFLLSNVAPLTPEFYDGIWIEL
jgi:endonuclease G